MLTIAEAARIIGARPRAVRWWVRKGWLPAIETPDGQRIRPEDVHAFIRDNRPWLRPRVSRTA